MHEPEPQLPQLELLRRQLRSPSRGTGYRAADELVRSGPEGIAMIKRALESRDRNVRIHAAWAVRLLDSPWALSQLISLLRDDREFYLPLQQALPAQPTPEVLEALLAAAIDRKNRNRKFHAMLLGDVIGEGVLDALLGALQSDDQMLQEGAFLAFKHAGEWLREQACRPLV
ncbi:MAG: HEAT repeat domain-containing protein [Candidatus Eremiobacteraeota bacterium]|nr:HEAT repeat domain-containing protein [Candidatus Eremiobacteraeota bacterium]